MTIDRAIEIIASNTRFASEYVQVASAADTEEQAQRFITKKETYKKRIEEFRAKRIRLLEK